ncbi:hypothetical protein OG896_24730 [Streptomyces sp. NBC_00669]|uniref:hypothetical protein n=1 Tax=Streptomyces sp. NBC_00669 TaxID=2976011 RepID=UPI002E3652F6|nr:hypothetical protein [Streptomyces sp. NBC_00669]
MRYTYRCDNCRASAPARRDRRESTGDRADHRRRAHHGLAPADRIMPIPGPLAQLARNARASYATQRPAGTRPGPRQMTPAERVATLLLPVLLLVLGILALH